MRRHYVALGKATGTKLLCKDNLICIHRLKPRNSFRFNPGGEGEMLINCDMKYIMNLICASRPHFNSVFDLQIENSDACLF